MNDSNRQQNALGHPLLTETIPQVLLDKAEVILNSKLRTYSVAQPEMKNP